MSDAQLYRTKDEVEEYKKIDPITQVLDVIKETNTQQKKRLKIDARVKSMVEECENLLKNQIFLKHKLTIRMWFTNKKIIHLSHKL
jgi:pyruvate dehydrogenase E1 component alpha subunit